MKCNLCETCSLNGMEQALPDDLPMTMINFLLRPDDAKTVLHVTTGKELEPAIDPYTERRRSQIIRKLAQVPFERLGPIIALSECIDRKEQDQCPLPISDDAYSVSDFPLPLIAEQENAS